VKKKSLAALIVLLLLAGAAALYAPRYLVYADKPVKADTIIVFEGGVDTSREKEAYRLQNEGYAGYLIIPAAHLVLTPQISPPRVADASKKNTGFTGDVS
jgi:hypothetical protein